MPLIVIMARQAEEWSCRIDWVGGSLAAAWCRRRHDEMGLRQQGHSQVVLQWMDDVPFEDPLLAGESLPNPSCASACALDSYLVCVWSGTMGADVVVVLLQLKKRQADGKINIRNDVAADELPDSSRSLPIPSCWCCSCLVVVLLWCCELKAPGRHRIDKVAKRGRAVPVEVQR